MARAPRAGERKQAGHGQVSPHLDHLDLAPDEAAERGRLPGTGGRGSFGSVGRWRGGRREVPRAYPLVEAADGLAGLFARPQRPRESSVLGERLAPVSARRVQAHQGPVGHFVGGRLGQYPPQRLYGRIGLPRSSCNAASSASSARWLSRRASLLSCDHSSSLSAGNCSPA
jgi:hypothetical protein